VPADVRNKIKAKEKEITAGTFKPFTGPIKDQNGKTVIPAGKTATLKELLDTNYFVEGVLGQIPTK
jgi:basic membrane lipoprotein Med (substrate-binding protein (PBP1-ABC) superfamily)